MVKNNKTCIVCGQKYTYCPTCADSVRLPKWMSIYHNENCKNLFEIASLVESGDISKEEAGKKLADCDLSYKDKLHRNIKAVVDECSVDSFGAKMMEKSSISRKKFAEV